MTSDAAIDPEPPAAPDAPVRTVTLSSRAWSSTRHFRPVLLLVALLFAFFALTQPVFLHGANLKDLLTAVSVLWVASMGMTFVVVSGGFDLSVGATAALVGIMIAKLLALSVPSGVVIILVLVFAAMVGLVTNGLLIGYLRLSFFVVTLATMIAFTGVVSLWANTQSFFVSSPTILAIGGSNWLGVPIAIWIMIGTFVIAAYVQQRTYFGRDVYATGGSILAARLAGVRTSRTLATVYAISGLCAGLAGILGVGRIGAASPTPDNTLPLDAAAAVLLGGTSLLGGSGGVGGTVLGVLFLGVLQNGLAIAGVQSFWQEIFTGVILVTAVLADRLVDQGGGPSLLRRRSLRRPKA